MNKHFVSSSPVAKSSPGGRLLPLVRWECPVTG